MLQELEVHLFLEFSERCSFESTLINSLNALSSLFFFRIERIIVDINCYLLLLLIYYFLNIADISARGGWSFVG